MLRTLLDTTILLGSIAAAILAWVAKLRWSNEFAAAKDETANALRAQLAAKDEIIKAMQAQLSAKDERNQVKEDIIQSYNVEIARLNNLLSPTVEEYYERLKSRLEKANGELKRELQESTDALDLKERQLEQLQSGNEANQKIEELESGRTALLERVKELEAQIATETRSIQHLGQVFEDPVLFSEIKQQTIGVMRPFAGSEIDARLALEHIKSHTSFLWKGFEELAPTKREFEEEIKEGTLNKVERDLERLRLAGHLDYDVAYLRKSTEDPTEQIFSVRVRRVTTQLRNLVALARHH